MGATLRRFFRLDEHRSTLRAEVIGGATTFAAMAYIIVVNPAILEFAGLPRGPSTAATVVVAAFGCLLMGLYANRPLAVAPYMGENAFLAFGLTAMGIGWELRLGAVFVAGVAFVVTTLVGLRTWLAAAVSPSMKHAFAVGIGLFLAFIGLYQSGLIVSSPTAPPVKLGRLGDRTVQLAAAGFVVTAVLLVRRVPGAILLGMVATAAAGYGLGVGKAPTAVTALPFTGPYDLSPILWKCDIRGALELSFLPILLTLLLMSFLDTLATLVAVGSAGGMLDEKGNLPGAEKPMLVDAVSCVVAAAVGTSTSGAYVESAAGVREGARTGLAAVVTGLLFAAALFFLPLFEPLQSLGYAYGPALVAVGAIMIGSARKIEWDDPTEGIPAFVAAAVMVFTYNIANGLTAGLALYPVLKLAAGRWRDLTAGSVLLGLVCLGYFLYGLPH